MSSHAKFRRITVLAYIGEGGTPKEADDNMLAVMERTNLAYQAGRRVTDDPDLQVLADIDPGSGPGQIEVTPVVLYGNHDDDDD